MTKTKTARQAARDREPLDGADAQALEGALTLTERELAAAEQRNCELTRKLHQISNCGENDECASFPPCVRHLIEINAELRSRLSDESDAMDWHLDEVDKNTIEDYFAIEPEERSEDLAFECWYTMIGVLCRRSSSCKFWHDHIESCLQEGKPISWRLQDDGDDHGSGQFIAKSVQDLVEQAAVVFGMHAYGDFW